MTGVNFGNISMWIFSPKLNNLAVCAVVSDCCGHRCSQAEIPLTESEVDDLIVTLDADLDEKLTYQELNKGLQLWRKHRRFIKKQSEGTDKKYLEITSKGEDNFPASDNSLSNVLMFDEKAFPILNTNESLSHDSRYHDLVSMSEEVAQSTDQNSEDLIKSLERRDRFSKETRPPSHNSSTHSRTSTPNSLEPPEPYLGKKAWLPASAEELVEIRKHDRIVLSRNKIRRSLTLEKRKAFDKLPGVIKIGYKPIDDHCSESTLGGDNADMVNQFRRQKLKEYYDVKKLFEERGLNFTQKTLDKVLLYPGDKPTSKLRKGIIMPVGPLTDELSSFIKWKQRSKKSQNWQKDNKQHYRSSDIGNGDEKVKTWTYGGDESDKGKSFLPRRAHRSKQRSRRMTNRDYLTAEDVYPFASTVTPKVYSKNLSSGRALISRKVDSWMTFEDYSKYTQNLPNRFHHVNKRSNPNAVWPGYLLNKLRLYMDSDLTLVDGHGRPLENRDSSAYEGYGTGMYNGRGNALFRHTAQPKRAYTGYNNDLLTWPVGKNGVRYGNIDEHRLVK